MGATQWILMLPFVLLPYLIYLPFGYLNRPYLGLMAIGFFGLVMLAMRSYWINYIARKLELKRYKIAEGFRE
jgi:hypothetical protein